MKNIHEKLTLFRIINKLIIGACAYIFTSNTAFALVCTPDTDLNLSLGQTCQLFSNSSNITISNEGTIETLTD
jgi:hypothetical protein